MWHLHLPAGFSKKRSGMRLTDWLFSNSGCLFNAPEPSSEAACSRSQRRRSTAAPGGPQRAHGPCPPRPCGVPVPLPPWGGFWGPAPALCTPKQCHRTPHAFSAAPVPFVVRGRDLLPGQGGQTKRFVGFSKVRPR